MSSYHVCGLYLAICRGSIFVFGNEILLTKSELLIMEQLMKRPGTIFSREQLMSQLKQANATQVIGIRTIDTHVTRIKKKLFPNNVEARKLFIVSVHDVGYRVSTRTQLQKII